MNVAPSDLEAEKSFFTGKVDSLAVTVYQNERPLHGLAGLLDWHLQGLLSSFFRAGFIAGTKNEIVYLPIQKGGKHLNLLLLGRGENDNPGERLPLEDSELKLISAKAEGLGLKNLGVSLHDFGDLSRERIEEKMKGLNLCLYH